MHIISCCFGRNCRLEVFKYRNKERLTIKMKSHENNKDDTDVEVSRCNVKQIAAMFDGLIRNISDQSKGNTEDMSALRIPDIISKKRDGFELTKEEIEFFVSKVVDKSFEGAQLGAMLMAIYLKRLNDAETTCLTHAMTHSGRVLTWPDKWKGQIVDKHSTGGVGDKISLLLVPALAACGMKVPMISGRGLAHTGGTLDKLESIPGFCVHLNHQEMTDILETVGCFIAGQTDDIVPADKIMYASRDVTGTVSNHGLITGSIISKKAAESLDALVLDVKTGKAAVIQDEKSARELATQMVRAGNGLGIKTAALLTNMDAPIGNMIGNSLEVVEAIEGLHGQGREDLYELVESLGGRALFLCGRAEKVEEGCLMIKRVIHDGTADRKFCAMLKAQGVKPDLADSLCSKDANVRELLPKSKKTTKVLCPANGYIHDIDGLKCAEVTCRLGAGRTREGEKIKHGVGLELMKHIGDEAKEGEPWIIVHHNEDELPTHILNTLNHAVVVKSTPFTGIQSRLIDVISA
ncbi:hypothetical protein CHS0354_020319 [Potamilus streckersoni]|uniref:Thymidine phosphorylase n=1 Tax=Potamilus streckersoni TaxID=2493646 RepID=A0AAE0S5W0_9BIVA|nr:hypothetical protein CHS0354_020319 [Potamilus streckersoni]